MSTHALPNDYESWVIARAAIGIGQNGRGMTDVRKPYDQVAHELLAGSITLDEALTHQGLDEQERNAASFRIAAKNPNGPAPKLFGRLAMPELPAYAHPPIAPEIGNHWLDRYFAYGNSVSPMTPRLFHEGAGLWLISLTIARRIMVPITASGIFPNLFIAWIAPTTLYRKTTGLNIARSISRHKLPHLLTPEDTTHEALLSDLAGMDPPNLAKMDEKAQERWKRGRDFAAQRGWCLDEMSGLLSSAGRDYNQGLIEALLRLYDCDTSFTRSTRGQGLLVVRSAYLSLLGASTPAALGPHFGKDVLWSNGWWPRWALLTPEGGRPEYQIADWNAPTESFVNPLMALNHRLPSAAYPDPPCAVTALLDEGVMRAWNDYSKAVTYDLQTDDLDTRLQGLYGRLPVQVMKVATNLAAMDWPEDRMAPRITMKHYARAVVTAESWRASAHRCIAGSQANDYAIMRERILRYVTAAGEQGILLGDVLASMRDKTPRDIRETIEQMVYAEDIREQKKEPGTVGRPGVRFFAVGN